MTLEQLLETATELRVQVPRERMQTSLHQAQLRRIERLSAGRPSVAAQLYAAAAALDPHVPTYHLLLGSELAAMRNISGANAATKSKSLRCLNIKLEPKSNMLMMERIDAPKGRMNESSNETAESRMDAMAKVLGRSDRCSS